ncbi:phosphoglycolate phosphatase [Denitratisoma sp. DHT3]|uniref:phosphoglycolate phosphatase n=1 Tax=Denitratisoma sp. DHT3 TaxID=1981880 RepID=UPI0016478824|nr:phosphoglycolate phosphatase [Denitratisoma sp. DHT3]
MSIEVVLFDLDGTLVDTAPDLIGALNRLLTEEGRAPLPAAALRRHVSGGTRALIGQGFGLTPAEPAYAALAERFLGFYERHVCDASRLFPGIPELLETLERGGTRWGIVTNKGRRFTEPLVRRLGLAERAACVISGDSAARAKPHPDPLLLACARAAVAPERSLYLGDDLRDIQAGHAAGMLAVVAAYGYLGDGPPYGEWGGDGVIQHPAELPELLERIAIRK